MLELKTEGVQRVCGMMLVFLTRFALEKLIIVPCRLHPTVEKSKSSLFSWCRDKRKRIRCVRIAAAATRRTETW